MEMTPTERVRELLDELGVRNWEGDDERKTLWESNGLTWEYFNDDNGDAWLGCLEACEDDVTPEQAIAATVGADEEGRGRDGGGRMNIAKHMRKVLESKRTCATCPEMDNPDSYIRHLQSALKWHDEHVPRPTNPRNTCVVLEGEKVPEEVLFIGANGVTHYLPESAGTCHMRLVYEEEDADGFIWPDHYECDACGAKVNGIMPFYDTEIPPKSCPNCGKRVIKEKAE